MRDVVVLVVCIGCAIIVGDVASADARVGAMMTCGAIGNRGVDPCDRGPSHGVVTTTQRTTRVTTSMQKGNLQKRQTSSAARCSNSAYKRLSVARCSNVQSMRLSTVVPGLHPIGVFNILQHPIGVVGLSAVVPGLHPMTMDWRQGYLWVSSS